MSHKLTPFLLPYIYITSTIDLWRSKIDARHNYWSYNSTLSVQSRIKDKSGKYLK